MRNTSKSEATGKCPVCEVLCVKREVSRGLYVYDHKTKPCVPEKKRQVLSELGIEQMEG